jgi:hypothetical protein
LLQSGLSEGLGLLFGLPFGSNIHSRMKKAHRRQGVCDLPRPCTGTPTDCRVAALSGASLRRSKSSDIESAADETGIETAADKK